MSSKIKTKKWLSGSVDAMSESTKSILVKRKKWKPDWNGLVSTLLPGRGERKHVETTLNSGNTTKENTRQFYNCTCGERSFKWRLEWVGRTLMRFGPWIMSQIQINREEGACAWEPAWIKASEQRCSEDEGDGEEPSMRMAERTEKWKWMRRVAYMYVFMYPFLRNALSGCRRTSPAFHPWGSGGATIKVPNDNGMRIQPGRSACPQQPLLADIPEMLLWREWNWPSEGSRWKRGNGSSPWFPRPTGGPLAPLSCLWFEYTKLPNILSLFKPKTHLPPRVLPYNEMVPEHKNSLSGVQRWTKR